MRTDGRAEERTKGQTDKHDEANRFSQFCERALKNCKRKRSHTRNKGTEVEQKYCCTGEYQRQKEVSVQRHVPASLPPPEGATVLAGAESGWAPQFRSERAQRGLTL